MSFEATKNLTGARQLVKLIEWELGTIDEYASSGFNSIGGSRGSGFNDRVAKALIRKEKVVRTLTSALNACLCIEEASQQELASVENLELRSLIIYRYIHNKAWQDIAREFEDGVTADAIKKRFERGLKAYENAQPNVEYSPNAQKAIAWIKEAQSIANEEKIAG